MFKKIALIIIVNLLSLSITVAYNDPAGGRAAAMGNASVVIADVYAAHNNVAATGLLKNYAFGVYSENKFLMQGLSSAGFVAVIPTATGTFSADFNYFGFDLYNEVKAGVGFGKALSSNFAIGAQVTFLSTTVAEYGTASTFTAQCGIIYIPIPKLTIGAHIFNPVHASMGESKEPLPVIFKLGGSYAATEKVLFITEFEKGMLEPVIIKAGIEYKANEHLYLRAGLQHPDQIAFGAGISTGNFMIDMAASYHQMLGFSPAFGLVYEMKKPK